MSVGVEYVRKVGEIKVGTLFLKRLPRRSVQSVSEGPLVYKYTTLLVEFAETSFKFCKILHILWRSRPVRTI